jgi:hypothetical protein
VKLITKSTSQNQVEMYNNKVTCFSNLLFHNRSPLVGLELFIRLWKLNFKTSQQK